MSSSRQRMRVYNRRPKKELISKSEEGSGSRSGSGSGSDKELVPELVDTRSDWANLQPKLLENVFDDLTVPELLNATSTCKQWRSQLAGGAVQAPAQAPTQEPAQDSAQEPVQAAATSTSWMDTIEGVLQHLETMEKVEDVDIGVMMDFLKQEGITKAP